MDGVKTNNYNSIGVSSDNELLRPVTWCKQRNDTVINGVSVSKSRNSYEPNMYPITNLISSVGIGKHSYLYLMYQQFLIKIMKMLLIYIKILYKY